MGRAESHATGPLVAATVVTVALLAVAPPLTAAAHESWTSALVQVPYFAPFSLVGLVVAWRQPRNAIGWLMLAITPVYMLGADAGMYAVVAFRAGHPHLPLDRLAVSLTQTWLFLPLLLPVPLLLYPDGRLPGGRWRVTVWLYVAASLLLLAGTAVRDTAVFTVKHVRIDKSGELASLGANSGGLSNAVGSMLFLVCLACVLSWVVRQVGILRHSTGDRRQQQKWLVAGATVGMTGFTMALLFSSSASPALQALGVGGFVASVAVPVSIGVGVLKYHLYDIDRVASRTVTYAVLTALLVGTYVGLVALTTRALPVSSPVAVAASTLAVAAMFSPVRRRVQHVVDRRFNRARYDSQALVGRFSAGVRDLVDVDVIHGRLVDTVQRAVEPSTLSIWLVPGSAPRPGVAGD